MYENGLGVAQDEAEAVRWYNKAEDQGDASAQTSLGFMYANGRGGANDEAESVRRKGTAARVVSERRHPPIGSCAKSLRLVGFRILCVIDDFSRECLATVVDDSISGIRVAKELDRIVELRGFPGMVVSDNDRSQST